MSRADIKLGYSCNNECIHCVISDFRDIVLNGGMPEDISPEDYKQELLDSRKRTDRVVFTGGEPTIRKELLDLVAFARDIGFGITMQTNGRKLADPGFAAALCSIAPINFCIALHGHTAEIHDAITQKPGSFYDTIQGIRNVIELRQGAGFLTGKIVISKVNAPYLLQTAKLMINLGFTTINLTFPHACGNARKDFFDVVPTYTEISESLLNAIDLCMLSGVSVDTETIPYCFLPNVEHIAVEIAMAEAGYTELKQYGFEEKIVDWSQKRLEIKEKFPQCKECRFDRVCEGPWNEYPQNYGSEEFKPVYGEPVTSIEQLKKHRHIPTDRRSRSFRYELDI
ncbi:MAG: radical SAM protein [Firmicutes bacterium]|nr:radical SAM protein [Bacillota bacterium]